MKLEDEKIKEVSSGTSIGTVVMRSLFQILAVQACDKA